MSNSTTSQYDIKKYKTPTGSQLTCKGWVQEAALRMLLNNLDPAVAERPDDLIVSDTGLEPSPPIRSGNRCRSVTRMRLSLEVASLIVTGFY